MKIKRKTILWGFIVLIMVMGGAIYESNRSTLSSKICGTFQSDINMSTYLSFSPADDYTFYYTDQMGKHYILGHYEIADESQRCAVIKCTKLENERIIPEQEICSEGLSLTVYIAGQWQTFTKYDEIPTKFYYLYQ